jgi:hypothetical protein
MRHHAHQNEKSQASSQLQYQSQSLSVQHRLLDSSHQLLVTPHQGKIKNNGLSQRSNFCTAGNRHIHSHLGLHAHVRRHEESH